MKDLGNIIIKPIVSEKSFAEAGIGKYTFEVAKFANKTDIKHAVEKFFDVKVVQVYTANITGSKTRNTRRGRSVINTSYKKARVKLAKGQKIDIFEEKTDDSDKKKKKDKEKESSK